MKSPEMQVVNLRAPPPLDFVSEIEADLTKARNYAPEVDLVRASGELFTFHCDYDLAIHFKSERVVFVNLIEADDQPVIFKRRSFHGNFFHLVDPERDQPLPFA